MLRSEATDPRRACATRRRVGFFGTGLISRRLWLIVAEAGAKSHGRGERRKSPRQGQYPLLMLWTAPSPALACHRRVVDVLGIPVKGSRRLHVTRSRVGKIDRDACLERPLSRASGRDWLARRHRRSDRRARHRPVRSLRTGRG